jgi:hypothetical protein
LVEDVRGDLEVAASRASGGCGSEGQEDEAQDVGDGGVWISILVCSNFEWIKPNAITI